MKKSLMIITALCAVFALSGCAFKEGSGDSTGPKWNRTMTVDATTPDFTESGKLYRRFFEQLGTKETVAQIQTTITVDKSEGKSIIENNNMKVVVGLIFDMQKNDDNTYDLTVVGVQPSSNKYYVERYTKVSDKPSILEDESEDNSYSGFDSNNTSLAISAEEPYTIMYTRDANNNKVEWAALPAGTYTNDTNSYSFDVSVKQSAPGTWEVFIGNEKVASYEGQTKHDKDTVISNGKGNFSKEYDDLGEDSAKYAVGAAGVYANCPVGTKVTATYTSDKSKTYGLFIDEE